MNEPLPQQPASSEAALEAARREKLRKIRELGIDPWGSRFDGHQPIGEIRARESEIVVEPAGECADRPAARTARPEGPRRRANRARGAPRARSIGSKSAIGPARSR